MTKCKNVKKKTVFVVCKRKVQTPVYDPQVKSLTLWERIVLGHRDVSVGVTRVFMSVQVHMYSVIFTLRGLYSVCWPNLAVGTFPLQNNCTQWETVSLITTCLRASSSVCPSLAHIRETEAPLRRLITYNVSVSKGLLNELRILWRSSWHGIHWYTKDPIIWAPINISALSIIRYWGKKDSERQFHSLHCQHKNNISTH